METIGNVIGHFVSIAAALSFEQWLLLAMLSLGGFILSLCQFANDTFDLRYAICTKADDHLGTDGAVISAGEWKPDLAKIVALGTWLGATWAILAMTMSGKLTEGYFGLWLCMGMAPKAVEAWIARKP